MHGLSAAAPIFLFIVSGLGLALVLLLIARLANPERAGRVKKMPYESGMDPIHDTRRRFDVRFHLLAIAFLVFDVELLFLYPWAAAMHPWSPAPGQPAVSQATTAPDRPTAPPDQTPRGIDAAVAGGLLESRHLAFAGVMVFLAILTAGFIYDWRKGIFRWR